MIVLWLAMLPASAQSLAWDWPPGTTRTWRIETVVGYSNPVQLEARHNIEGRAERIQIEQLWTCRAEETGRTGWDLACTIDDVRLIALPLAGEETAVEAVLGELDAALTGAVVQLQLNSDGHLRSVDLEGIDKDGRRTGAIHETLRLLVARGAAVLDLHLPANGDLKPTWKQRDDLVYAYPIAYGTLSGARITHTLVDHDERHVSVRSVGSGTVRVGQPAPMPSRVPGGDEPWMLDMSSEAQALFDGIDGHLVARRWVAVGRPLPSSGWQVGKAVEPYLQTGILEGVEPGKAVSPLGPSGLWTEDFQPGPAWRQLLTSPLWDGGAKP